jgi:hypothetical protein
VRVNLFVLAAADLYPGGSEVSGVRAEPFEGNPVKMQQLGGPKLELPLRIGVVLDQFNDRIELFKAVPGLYARSLVGVGKQLGIESLAMPVLVPRPPLVVIPSGARNLLLVALATPPLDRLSPG